MSTIYDDHPHPVPAIAYLLWKENWFFVLLDAERRVCGVAHFNYEPARERARCSLSLDVAGRSYRHRSERPFPQRFDTTCDLGDERLRLRIVEPGARFALDVQAEEFDLNVMFVAHSPVYDFAASEQANPNVPSLREVLTLGTNVPCWHQEQALTMTGTLRLHDKRGERISLAGIGYRDHSQMMRTDNLVGSHIFSWYFFDGRVFGITQVWTIVRPQLIARAGFVWDSGGMRALKHIDIQLPEGNDWTPAAARYALTDVGGQSFTLVADLEDRLGQASLVSEKPRATHAYEIAEIFCRARLEQTQQHGLGHFEIGRQKLLQPPTQP